MIAVVDYGAGNLRSVCNALDLCAKDYRIAKSPNDLNGARGILLPGVGHFGPMMRALDDLGFAMRLKSEAAGGTPLLGICLGMQAMYEASEEASGVQGLTLFAGTVKRFTNVPRVPHMGWNDVESVGDQVETFYFAHSFYAPVSEWTTGICRYGQSFSASVRRDNVAGVQFHPEKSGEAGLALLSDWCGAC